MALGTVLLAMGFGILSAAAATVAGFGFLAALAAYALSTTATLAALLMQDMDTDHPHGTDLTQTD